MKKRTVIFGIIITMVLMGCTVGKAKESIKQPAKVEAVKVTTTAIAMENKFSLLQAGLKETYIKGDVKADLTGAEINGVYPLQLREGALMSVSGTGFGDKAGAIKVGSVEVTEFLKWEDEVIWFRVPKNVKDADTVTIGDSISEQQIKIVSESAIRVVWQIDAKKAQEIINKNYDAYNAEESPVIEFPLYVKGQWSKKNETFGTYAGNWDGGSRTVMYNVAGTDVWESECYFTEENFENSEEKIVYFAIEDSNKDKRKLSAFESDAALIIKKEWGAADKIDASDNDPGFKVSIQDVNYNKENNTVYVVFPVVKK